MVSNNSDGTVSADVPHAAGATLSRLFVHIVEALSCDILHSFTGLMTITHVESLS